MAKVFIPSLMRKLTEGRESTVARGRTVGEIIDDLDRQFPGFRRQVVEGRELKHSVAVSIDGEIATEGLLEPVGESSEVHFVPAIAGG